MKRITFNLNDPLVERWLGQQVAQGQQQTEVIASALRQAATMDGSSPREQALHEEIARLHRLIERIVATGTRKEVAPDPASGAAGSLTTDTWTW